MKSKFVLFFCIKYQTNNIFQDIKTERMLGIFHTRRQDTHVHSRKRHEKSRSFSGFSIVKKTRVNRFISAQTHVSHA